MIEIPLTKVRIAPSPLWETVTSFGVLLHHQGCDTVHAPWAVRARRVLPGTGGRHVWRAAVRPF
jgi:hypothetical protein